MGRGFVVAHKNRCWKKEGSLKPGVDVKIYWLSWKNFLQYNVLDEVMIILIDLRGRY